MAKVVEGFRASGGIRILKSCCSVAVLRRYSSGERILEVNVGERLTSWCNSNNNTIHTELICTARLQQNKFARCPS